jgi:hypothetical protein
MSGSVRLIKIEDYRSFEIMYNKSQWNKEGFYSIYQDGIIYSCIALTTVSVARKVIDIYLRIR